jgi:hypothetical protein
MVQEEIAVASKAAELDIICNILDRDNIDIHAVREWLSLMKAIGFYTGVEA